MKSIVRILLALVVVSATVAWASDGDLEQALPTAEAAQPDQVEPEADAPDTELTAEDLENMDPGLVEAGACCRAECFGIYMECRDGCDIFDSACMNQCRTQYDACKANC